jgi:hypothetical protein
MSEFIVMAGTFVLLVIGLAYLAWVSYMGEKK